MGINKKDDIWSFEELTPKSKHTKVPQHDTSTQEISFIPSNIKSPWESITIPPKASEKVEKVETMAEQYSIPNNLVYSVSLTPLSQQYGYYDEFIKNAKEYYSYCPCEEAQPAPYFAYAPQYSQLNGEQKKWYFYLRECIRHDKYPDTPESYLTLLAYEIINLADAMPVEEGMKLLTNIWVNYRKKYVRMDSRFPDMIISYGLIHRVAPLEEASKVIIQSRIACQLREFFIPVQNVELFEDYLSLYNVYSPLASKYCTKNNYQAFKSIVTEVMKKFLEITSKNGIPFQQLQVETMHKSFISYENALCASQNKKHIMVEYIPLAFSHNLHMNISGIMRHTENRIRTIMGVHSHLKTGTIPEDILSEINQLLDGILPKEREKKVSKQIPEYEKNYDLQDNSISLQNAKDVESKSWSITEKLVDAEEIDELLIQESRDEKSVENIETKDEQNESIPLVNKYRAILKAIIQKDKLTQEKEVKKIGKPFQAVIDAINEEAYDVFGDIIVENGPDGYSIIEDYLDEVNAMIN